MHTIFERACGLDAALDGVLERRPGLARSPVYFGFLLLLLVGLLAVGAGAAVGGDRRAEIVYATEDGSVVSVEPASGETVPIYEGDARSFATAPARTGGSRGLAFSVLRGEGPSLRGDVYTVDLERRTRARLTSAVPGEAFLHPVFSIGRVRILASRYAEQAPNVTAMPASGAGSELLDPGPGATAILGPAWVSDDALYAWLSTPGKLSLMAHDLFERRRTVIYETQGEVGPFSYFHGSNTILFAERPRGAGLAGSEIKLLIGDQEVALEGADVLGLYDPSPPTAALDDGMAVMWTDGEEWGVGIVDPEARTFHKTAVPVGPGSRYPQISSDGLYVATADGASLTVRRLEDGGFVRRIQGVQTPEVAFERLRKAGFDVPSEAAWLAPPSFGWRSLEDEE